MITFMKQIGLFGLMVLLASMIGCQKAQVETPAPATALDEVQVALECQYEVGQSERVVVTHEKKYESWVEMPGKDSAVRNSRTNGREVTMLREVKSVEADGSALIEVTLESVEVHLEIDTQKSKSKHHYTSNKTGTDSSWDNEPEVAGTSYQIRVAPDTTVLEVIGLDAARSNLKIKEGDKGIVANLLTEKGVKRLHERSFVQDYPGPDAVMAIPDAMIKAQAIQKTYVYKNNGKTIVALSIGEALHTLPEGVTAPPKASDMGQTMILSMSEMDELVVSGRGVFDLKRSAVVSEENSIKSVLIFDEASLSAKFNKPESKGTGGLMFTVTEITSSYKVLP